MSLRIPLAPDQTLQTEFHEIERRLRKLERATGVSVVTTIRVAGGGGSTPVVNLAPLIARIEALEAAIGEVDLDDLPNLGPVGPTAQKGLAPSPGLYAPPTGVAEHVLTEDAVWGFPVRGLMQVVSSGDETVSEDRLAVLGSLHLNGGLSADEIVGRKVTILGPLIVSGYLATSEDELSVAGLV